MVDLTKLYSLDKSYPTWIPDRIRLSDGSTKSNRATFTQEDLDDAGWIQVEDPPSPVVASDQGTGPGGGNTAQKLTWTGVDWKIVDKDEQEHQEQWVRVREYRDKLIEEFEWKIYRYESEVRQGVTPTDDISEMDTYVQALRDVPQQDVESPWHVVWPSASKVVEEDPDKQYDAENNEK